MVSIPHVPRAASAAGIFLAVLAYSQASQDTISLAPPSISTAGVLASGPVNGTPVVYRAYRANSNQVPVDNFSAASSTDEILAFTPRHPMAILPAQWTAAADSVALQFAPEISIPVTVWVIKGPFAAGRQRALDMVAAASQIWIDQGMGVAFQSVDIRDATQFSQFQIFNCSKRNALQAAIPPVPGQINIYLVRTVDGSPSCGQACGVGGTLGGVMVATGSAAPADLLTHEIGHNFGLTDRYPGSTGFDATNVMYKFSNTRQYFTEGQIFRAHMTPSSSLNFLYAKRPGQPTRLCTASANSNTCPSLDKRVWPDGAFPAN